MTSHAADIDFSAHRFLPRNSAEAMAVPLASLDFGALIEALAGGANDEARRAMARLIAKHGRKYTDRARKRASAIADGNEPLPPVPEYMIKQA